MKAKKAVGYLALASAGTLGYSNVIERRNFALRFKSINVLEPGCKPLTILHLSDIHMTENQAWKEKWIASLAKFQPDLVINTGDNLSSIHALPAVQRALAPLLEFPGAFVAGSNDYVSPNFRNPAKYLKAPSSKHYEKGPEKERDLPFEEMFSHFESHGWLNLNNAKGELTLDGIDFQFSGVDDPHLELDEFQDFPEPANNDKFKLGVIHAPYQRVLDEFTDAGAQLILAGHTHGGQLRIPGYGSVVANCDIPLDQARGLSQWHTDGKTSWLNVSAGLGNSPYFPFRFACRPEATLLALLPRS